MRPATILSLAVVAICTAATDIHMHAVADLIARAMDPATMNPTKVSVLSVLKTAMPAPTGTATNIVLPTGKILPQWFQNLPDDVMVLLAQLYPGAPTTAATAAPAANNSSSSTQNSTDLRTASLTTSTTRLGSALATAAATGHSNGSTVVSTGSLVGITKNGTLSTAAPGLDRPGKSAGAKNTVDTGARSALMGLSVAVAFCVFA